jgi:hypothetical protein
MKTMVMIIAALLAGLVLGSWSVKVDLRRAEREVTTLRKELSRRPASLDGRLTGIASMLKIPDAAEAHPKDRAPEPVQRADESPALSTNTAGSNVVGVSLGHGNLPAEGHAHRPKRGDFRKQMETAASAWQVRSDLARNGFLSKVTENDEQAAQFEVTMAAMNLRLSNSVRTWVDYVKEAQNINSEDGIRIMNDLSTALVQAYDDLDRAMPADWRTKAGSGFEVVNFINPDVVLPLTEVEDVFAKAHDTNNPTDPADVDAP